MKVLNKTRAVKSLPLVSLAAVFSLVTQRGGALRDETKNGCEGDYVTSRVPLGSFSNDDGAATKTSLANKQLHNCDVFCDYPILFSFYNVNEEPSN